MYAAWMQHEREIKIQHLWFHVAACNKTYYGDVGKTYDLELHRPKEDKVPYICKLTFNAPGDDFGDIVQVRAIEFHKLSNTTNLIAFIRY